MKHKHALAFMGWIVFSGSFILYLLTLEPTTSFWDCSEFILSASKLEVNHPSGAPLFMLLGRLFSLLSFGNPQKIAWAVNLMSGFFSSLTIYFLYHVIVLLARKLTENFFQIIGSAIVGALTFAFTDSFWFSAVEGEVYALSMFFLVICFWAVLKWEVGFGNEKNNQWVLFISFMTGLGLGVHLLNLLVLPSVVMIICFKRYGYSVKVLIGSLLLGCTILLSVLYAVTPVFLWYLSVVELLFVNSFNMPVNSGLITSIILFILSLIFVIRFLKRRNKSVVELAVLSVALLLVGFSVYAVTLIRSQANPPVNFGQPNNIYSLIDYLNREQYPKRPLVYGEGYNSPVTGVKQRHTKALFEGQFKTIDLPSQYSYAPESCTWFPRLYSKTPGHEEAYRNWVGIKGKTIKSRNMSGKTEKITVPTFGDNVRFFLRFQVGHMYWRYFMWNFVGRQNDIQGRGELTKGNWLSGIKPIDSIRLGHQNNLPEWLRNNKARNTYFFIPLILGLIGLVFHYKSNKESFFAVLILYLIAGLGLVIYINEIPIVPRERDYVFVGSFLAFSIWIGLSVINISRWISDKLPSKILSVVIFILIFIGSPVLILYQNYDDHNRSDRYAARDFAANILNSCPKDAILFTSGDNDTYPLLYCQEVEKIRLDVRIVIMPFLSANWFIDQLKSPIYNNEGLKMALPQKKHDDGRLDYVRVYTKIERKVNLKEVLGFIKSDNKGTTLRADSGEVFDYVPANELYFDLEVEGKRGEVPVSFKGKKILYKHELAFWDIVASNIDSRPICFVSKAEANKHGLLNYVRTEGLVCRIVPERNSVENIMGNLPCDHNKLYDQLMHDFKWGNIDDPNVYVDYNTVYNARVFQLRNVFNQLAAALLKQGENEKAKKVLKKSMSLLAASEFSYDMYSLQQIELVMLAGMNEKGIEQIRQFLNTIKSNLNYYNSFNDEERISLLQDIRYEIYFWERLARIVEKYQLNESFSSIREDFEEAFQHSKI